jgi:hypothetical protein
MLQLASKGLYTEVDDDDKAGAGLSLYMAQVSLAGAGLSL